jgi:hypothetical protein
VASPTVQARNSGSNTATTSHTINLPTGISAGDLLFVLVAFRALPGTLTLPSGWAYVEDDQSTSQALVAAYKTADGTEGSTASFTSANSVTSAHFSWRISGWSGTPERGTAATGVSANPNPPSLTPAGGSADYLFIAAGSEIGPVNFTAYPTNYTDGQFGRASSGLVSALGVAERQVTASSEDPAAFTTNSAGTWMAQTYVIAPLTAAVIDVSVACATATTSIRSAGKVIAATATSATVRLKQIGKVLAVSSSTATTARRAVARALLVGSAMAVTVKRALSKTIAVAASTATALRRVAARTLALASTTTTTRLKTGGKIIAVTSLTATTNIKRVGKSGLAMAVSTTTTLIAVRAKVIAIAMSTTVVLRRDVAKMIAVRCFGLITRVIGKGFLPGIRQVRAALQKMRGADPSLDSRRTTRATLYKTRTDDPNLDQ